jgi:hypothetical protein
MLIDTRATLSMIHSAMQDVGPTALSTPTSLGWLKMYFSRCRIRCPALRGGVRQSAAAGQLPALRLIPHFVEDAASSEQHAARADVQSRVRIEDSVMDVPGGSR